MDRREFIKAGSVVALGVAFPGIALAIPEDIEFPLEAVDLESVDIVVGEQKYFQSNTKICKGVIRELGKEVGLLFKNLRLSWRQEYRIWRNKKNDVRHCEVLRGECTVTIEKLIGPSAVSEAFFATYFPKPRIVKNYLAIIPEDEINRKDGFYYELKNPVISSVLLGCNIPDSDGDGLAIHEGVTLIGLDVNTRFDANSRTTC